VADLRSRLAARSTAETTAATPEVTTTAASTSTELASTARTAASTAPISSSALALVLSSTSTAAAVVLNLGEAIIGRGGSCCGLRGIVSPALGAGHGCGLVRSLNLSRVTGDDLERLAERLVLTTGLFVPLRGRSSVSSLGLNAGCRRGCRLLGLQFFNCR
jgi:hypothetical protein